MNLTDSIPWCGYPVAFVALAVAWLGVLWAVLRPGHDADQAMPISGCAYLLCGILPAAFLVLLAVGWVLWRVSPWLVLGEVGVVVATVWLWVRWAVNGGGR